MTALDRDPVNRRWQRLISQYVDHFEEPTGSGWALPLVWRMRDQTDQAG
jgi:L-rhamnose mutarotase